MTKIFTTLFVFILFALVGAAPAQFSRPGPTDLNPKPFDFTKDFYYNNGVELGSVMLRRTGTDGFSVFDKAVDPNFSNIRVTVTLAAYSQKGTILYWYPLGELNENGFRSDKVGYAARKTAGFYPIYVFPEKGWDRFTFGTGRQAAVIDETRASTTTMKNPLGLRQVFLVNYTEKAFTPDYEWLMMYYAKKNGMSSDDTPILNTVEDIMFMYNKGLVTTDTMPGEGPSNPHGQYMVAPIIYDPTGGAIAKDAFIWMAMKDGKCLPTEEIFEDHFNCLLTGGKWCAVDH